VDWIIRSGRVSEGKVLSIIVFDGGNDSLDKLEKDDEVDMDSEIFPTFGHRF